MPSDCRSENHSTHHTYSRKMPLNPTTVQQLYNCGKRSRPARVTYYAMQRHKCKTETKMTDGNVSTIHYTKLNIFNF